MLTRAVYTLLLTLAAPFLLYGLYKKKPNKPNFGPRWKEHFGLTPPTSSSRPLWIHAVSVGESIAAISLINEIKKRYPQQPIVVTTTTSTGAQQIKKLGDLVEHRYMPLDFPFAIAGFLNSINPSKLLIIETELWPNTLVKVAQRHIPIVIINARLSKKSYQNYRKVMWLFKTMSQHITLLLCQTEQDKQRFIRLGIPESRVEITGSIKLDQTIPPEVFTLSAALKTQLGERPIWIAASTHEGEEKLLLNTHKQLLANAPQSLLILVPRHPERFDSVANLIESMNMTQVRRTSNQAVTMETQVYLADTMGEMLVLLGAANVCFMGGSLIGEKVGGHNVLEPVSLGLPTITGPSYFNFQLIVDELANEGKVKIISNITALRNALENKIGKAPTLDSSVEATSTISKGSLSLTVDKVFNYENKSVQNG